MLYNLCHVIYVLIYFGVLYNMQGVCYITSKSKKYFGMLFKWATLQMNQELCYIVFFLNCT